MYTYKTVVSCACWTKAYVSRQQHRSERDGVRAVRRNHLSHIVPHAGLFAPGVSLIGSALAAETASLAHEKAGNDIVKRSRH